MSNPSAGGQPALSVVFPVIPASSLAVGQAPVSTPTITGGYPPYTLSVVGNLTPGRVLTGNTITGTFTAAGSYSYQTVVKDSFGNSFTTQHNPTIAPTLNTLTLGNSTFSLGEFVTSVVGLTPGSVYSATSSNGLYVTPGGGSIRSQWTTSGAQSITITETLSGITKTTVIPVTVTGSSTTSTPVANAFYQLASNRFAFPTDIAAVSTGYAASTGSSMGTGTQAAAFGQHGFRRWAFDTFADATPTTPAVFAWPAGFQAAAGVYDVNTASTGFTIEAVYIRKQSDFSLVTTLTFNGSQSQAMPSGGSCFNDPITALPAGSYFLDVCWKLDANGGVPSSSPACGNNEYSKGSLSGSDASYATGTAPAGAPAVGTPGTLGIHATGYAAYGPAGYFVKTATVLPAILIVGDSREDHTNMYQALLDGHGDFGHIKVSLSKATTGGGRMPWVDCSRYSAGLACLQPASTPQTGLPQGVGVFNFYYNLFNSKLGQTRSPFNAIYSEHGVNSLNQGSTLAGMKSLYGTTVGYARSLWPNIPWVQETILPDTNVGTTSPYCANTDDSQQPVATTTPANIAATSANGGWIDTLNSWIASGGGGLFAVAPDVYSTAVSPNYGSSWKNGAKSGTLRGYPSNVGTNVPAATTSVVTLDFAPDLGSNLVFDPTVSTVDTGYTPVAVVTNATNSAYYDVTLWSNGRGPQLAAKKVAVAHSVGAVVKQSSTPEGLHQTQQVSLTIAATIDAVKSNIRSAALAYTGS